MIRFTDVAKIFSWGELVVVVGCWLVRLLPTHVRVMVLLIRFFLDRDVVISRAGDMGVVRHAAANWLRRCGGFWRFWLGLKATLVTAAAGVSSMSWHMGVLPRWFGGRAALEARAGEAALVGGKPLTVGYFRGLLLVVHPLTADEADLQITTAHALLGYMPFQR